MAKKIVVELSDEGIDRAINELRQYVASIPKKEKKLRQQLSTIGVRVASSRFGGAAYDGTNDVSVGAIDAGNTSTIQAKGKSVAFIEFGAGIKEGYGHPQAGELGVGPGTYPSEKHLWDNPKGWWFGSGQHSYGNPPAQAMYSAAKEITENVTRTATGVFRS